VHITSYNVLPTSLLVMSTVNWP